VENGTRRRNHNKRLRVKRATLAELIAQCDRLLFAAGDERGYNQFRIQSRRSMRVRHYGTDNAGGRIAELALTVVGLKTVQ